MCWILRLQKCNPLDTNVSSVEFEGISGEEKQVELLAGISLLTFKVYDLESELLMGSLGRRCSSREVVIVFMSGPLQVLDHPDVMLLYVTSLYDGIFDTGVSFKSVRFQHPGTSYREETREVSVTRPLK